MKSQWFEADDDMLAFVRNRFYGGGVEPDLLTPQIPTAHALRAVSFGTQMKSAVTLVARVDSELKE